MATMATTITTLTTPHLVSRRLSAGEVENCIRNAGPIFHILPPDGRTVSFTLRPPTILDESLNSTFNHTVYTSWAKGGQHTLPSLIFSSPTASFTLGPHPINLTSLENTLKLLTTIALQEATALHLISGGDERLHLSSSGNKYFCPPIPVPSAIIRGTCTCSPPSQEAFTASSQRLNSIWDGVESLPDAYDDVRRRISTALGLQTPHHIILHPSGTDAEYTPLLIGTTTAKALHCSGVVSIVVGAGEVGSNTPNAAGGKHFSQFMPNGGQASTLSLVDDSSLPEGTKVVQLSARLPDGSMVSNFDEVVINTVQKISTSSKSPFFIVHAVDGSKLGSHITTRHLVTALQARLGNRLLVVLDACQGRTDTSELDWYLSHGAVVLMTASKFYSAPGFCGMAIVPDSKAGDLKKGVVVPRGMGDYLTKWQVPGGLKALREGVPEQPVNVGLLMRWTCGVVEMERVARVGKGAREGVRKWVDGVRGVIGGVENLEAMEGGKEGSQLGGVNSIVAFKVLVGGVPLKTEALKSIHRWLTVDCEELLPGRASEEEKRAVRVRCFIGQPVDLGEFAVLRLAIGAGLAAELGGDLGRLERALEGDRRILDKIEVLRGNYDEMVRREG